MDRLIESTERPLQVHGAKKLTGPFTVLDEFNQNGRRYPGNVYLSAYQELVPKIKERRLMGELDHPLEYDEVRLSNVSHVITECHMEDSSSGKKVVYGTVELLDTPSGKIAQALVKAGIPLGISSRAVGNTKRVSEGVDVTQLKLITYDLVAEPSFSTAILSEEKKSALSESLDLIESKLPLNESNADDPIRDQIHRIRESLCSPETVTETEIHIEESTDIQTLEVVALKELLESKSRTISNDTKLLKESRSKIKNLESKVASIESRYKGLKENHQKLQDAYNEIKSSKKLEEKKLIESLQEEVVNLRKRLAVERRGMSYDQVSSLLEGVTTDAEISRKLDTFSKFSKRSNVVSSQNLEKINESLTTDSNKSRLSNVVSRV